jgi:hypothetical protein
MVVVQSTAVNEGSLDAHAGRKARFPGLVRILVLVVPLHLIAFVVLYLALLKIVEREMLLSHSSAARLLARTVVEELHLVMVGVEGGTVEDGLATLSEAHQDLHLQLFDAQGQPLAGESQRGMRPRTSADEPADEVGVLRGSDDAYSIARTRDGWELQGQMDIIARSACVECHAPGERLGIAHLSYDITGYVQSAVNRLGWDLAGLLAGWLALVGLTTLATRGVVRRSVARLRADVAHGDGSGGADVQDVSRLALDPLSAELYASLRDVLRTQREHQREIAARLEHTDRLASLGRIAAGLAHEIKNPIAGLQGALEILRDETDDAGKRELFVQMLAETGRVNDTVQSLLQYARTARPRPVRIDLEELFGQIASLLGPGFTKRGVTLECSTAPELEAVWLDPVQIRQVLVNLLTNSAEAMEGHGTIRLRATTLPSGDGVLLAVDDEGPGIDADVGDRIFEPFFTTKYAGTGLGLAVARSLVEAHGGRIEVRSEIGRGTTFLIVLPPRPSVGGSVEA